MFTQVAASLIKISGLPERLKVSVISRLDWSSWGTLIGHRGICRFCKFFTMDCCF